MPVPRPRRLAIVALSTAVALLSAAGLALLPQRAAATVLPAPTAAHPYSDPLWSPLRTPALISCVKTNCTSSGSAYHGYWAVDFIGHRGDPVYAAGAGIAHIYANRPDCVTSSSEIESGTSVWIDHGGGKVTKYNHLDAILITEGQRVTPTTMIGRMGHAGSMVPCTTDYLHFEVRVGGLSGTRVSPGTLLTCTSSGLVRMPAVFGVTSFDALPMRKFATPAADNNCISDTWNRTPVAPVTSVRPGVGSAVVSWGTPAAGTTGHTIATELWSPSVQRWNAPVYSYASATATSATIAGLVNTRLYRVTVAARNGYGVSAWSTARTVVPATVPSTPVAPRFLTSPTPTYVHYGWWKSAANGSIVTRYQVGYRCAATTTYGLWRSVYTSGTVYYANITGLSGLGTCQVKVRAANAMGVSGWSVTSTIRKLR